MDGVIKCALWKAQRKAVSSGPVPSGFCSSRETVLSVRVQGKTRFSIKKVQGFMEFTLDQWVIYQNRISTKLYNASQPQPIIFGAKFNIVFLDIGEVSFKVQSSCKQCLLLQRSSCSFKSCL